MLEHSVFVCTVLLMVGTCSVRVIWRSFCILAVITHYDCIGISSKQERWMLTKKMGISSLQLSLIGTVSEASCKVFTYHRIIQDLPFCTVEALSQMQQGLTLTDTYAGVPILVLLLQLCGPEMVTFWESLCGWIEEARKSKYIV